MRRITIKKTITINAQPEAIWKVLFGSAEVYKQWAKEFSEGPEIEGDWSIDSVVIFKDKTNNGLVARVVKNRKNEVLSVEYEGVIVNGEKVYTGPAADAMNGGMETYMLEESGSKTYLHIESDIGEEYVTSTSEAWDRALEIIKTLAENNT
jgi:hypothetical protein